MKKSAICCSLLLLAHPGRLRRQHRTGTHRGKPPVIKGVTLATVATGSVTGTETFVGTVESPDRGVLAARIDGQVDRILVREGDRVRRGAPLLTIRRQRCRRSAGRSQSGAPASRREMAAAQARLELARKTEARYRRLFTDEAVTPQEMDRVSTELETARHQFAAARAARDGAVAARGAARTALSYTRVVAPFAGRIVRKKVEAGTTVMPGTPLLVLDRGGELAGAGESARDRFSGRCESAGFLQRRRCLLSAAPLPARSKTSFPRQIPAAAPSKSKLSCQDAQGLSAGMFARASLAGGSRKTLLIPRSALVTRGQLTGDLYGRKRDSALSAGTHRPHPRRAGGDPLRAAPRRDHRRHRHRAGPQRRPGGGLIDGERRKHSLPTRIVDKFLDGNLSVILILLALVAGAAALMLTPREEEPQIVVPLADVYVHMPGASAKEVEKLVATPLEKLLWQVDGVEYVYSMSRPGMAVVTARFYVGEDRIASLVKLHNKISTHTDLVPPGVTGWVIKPVAVDDVPIVNLTLYSKQRFGLRAAPGRRGGGRPAAVGEEHLGDHGHRRPPPPGAGGDRSRGDGRPGHRSARRAPGSCRRQPGAAGRQLSSGTTRRSWCAAAPSSARRARSRGWWSGSTTARRSTCATSPRSATARPSRRPTPGCASAPPATPSGGRDGHRVPGGQHRRRQEEGDQRRGGGQRGDRRRARHAGDRSSPTTSRCGSPATTARPPTTRSTS